MNQERQKTDAIADAVEIKLNAPIGATHYCLDSFGNVFYILRHKHYNQFIGDQPLSQIGSIKPL